MLSASPSALTVSVGALAWSVNPPVVLLVGNHDLPPAVLKASSIEIYDTLRVPNIWVAA